MRSNSKKMIAMLSGLAAVLLFILVAYTGCGNRNAVIRVDGGDSQMVEYGDTFTAPAGQFYKNNKADASVAVQVEGSVDTGKLGKYTLVYTATFNKKVIEKKVEITVRDTKAPVISLVGGEEVAVRPGSTYKEQGFSAIDNLDGDITLAVKVDVTADKITYTATDSSGNSVSVDRKIVYRDADGPVITILGENDIMLEVGDSYKDQGASAIDDTDGDVTSRIQVSGSVNTQVPGIYKIIYRVADAAGNESEACRIVKVRDTEAPVITLTGDKKIYLKRGELFVDPGYSVSDNIEGDLTGKVVVSGSVDTGKLGVYTITYAVKDSFDNEATETREVYVYIEQADVSGNAETGDKRIYLTFDDGPSVHTQELLDILAKYNVKVTFFVTNQKPAYQEMIKKEAEAGHTIAIHTYSHKYEKLYASVDAYFDDLEKMSDIVKKQTGMTPTILRFPGGTSNKVSMDYCKGIMTKLSKMVPELGYKYIDWNITSGDSEPSFLKPYKTDAEKRDAVAANTIKQIEARKGKYSVVLQHDITQWSVQATEQIILWGLANGYTFLPLTQNSPNCVHKPNN